MSDAPSPSPLPTFETWDADALERGRWLFAQPIHFLRGATTLDSLPPMGPTEVAFAGRSNVGKSSLINALCGQKTLARTSNTPGRTQQLNFFAVADAAHPALLLVDLPGYGYAREAKGAVKQWNRLIRDYLRGRTTLRRVMLLIDARHGLKANDLEIIDLLDEAAVSYQVVLTKADKVPAAALQDVIDATRSALQRRPAAHPYLLATSSNAGTGIDALRATLASLADFSTLRYKN